MPQEPEIDLEIQEQLAKFSKLFERKVTKATATDERADDELIRKVAAFVESPVDFKPGDIVRWKKGLKNKKMPADEQPAVVINQLSKPIIVDKDSGTPYFNEPLDLVLAFTGREGELVVFYYDRRRFKRVEENGADFSDETIQRLAGTAK